VAIVYHSVDKSRFILITQHKMLGVRKVIYHPQHIPVSQYGHIISKLSIAWASSITDLPNAVQLTFPRPFLPPVSQNTTAEEFARRFERPRLPVVITGLCDAWPAAQAWTPEALMERFAHHKFKVGSGL